MKYGQISENNKINQTIYSCFNYFTELEQIKFVKKFKDQPHDHIQIIHTFRELIVGTFLRANGFLVENDRNIDSKTPDWLICDKSKNVIAILEIVNFHIDNKTNESIQAQVKEGKKVISYWPNANDPNYNRLYDSIRKKASKYKNLVSKRNIPYIVAVSIDNIAIIDVQDAKDCLLSGETPLFKLFPDLSGVLHFEEASLGSYCFTYIENPFATHKIIIPSGIFMGR